MTVLEAIQEIDSLKPNAYPQAQKVVWLDRLDQFIQRSVLDRYPQRAAEVTFETGDPERELLMPVPFDQGYLHWLESKIHYFNEEIDRYNSAVRMFRSVFEDYQRELHRRAEPSAPGPFRI